MGRFPFLVLFAAGGFSALALPPVGWWWILALTFPLLLRRLEVLPTGAWRGGFGAGLGFGLGYFIAAFHWIGFAFLVDAKTNLWMMPFAVGGLALYMALFWAVAGALAVCVPDRLLPRFASLAIFLSIAEWLRGHLLTGFPWAAPGLVADGMGGVGQLASIIGMPGLTMMILTWAMLPDVIWRNRRAAHYARAVPVVLLLVLPASLLWGVWRLAEHPTVFRQDVKLRLVQPNTSQSDKWRTENSGAIFDSLLALSGDADGSSHVIWPESAVPFLLEEEPAALARIAQMLGPERRLLTGAIRRTHAKGLAGEPDGQYFTSILLIDGMGSVRGTYDKWRLVPGGEFLPFEPLLARLGFRKVVSLPESFTPGQGPTNLDVPGAGLAGMLICYEAIFPHRLVAKERPLWLVNVTNDGWFGNSVGPYQHLAQMRMRAIEQGLPVARAANTGISAVIDPMGRITAQSRLGVAAVVDGALPEKSGETIYAMIGDVALLLLVGGFGFLMHFCQRYGRSSDLSSREPT